MLTCGRAANECLGGGGCFLVLACRGRGEKAREVMNMDACITPYYVHLQTK